MVWGLEIFLGLGFRDFVGFGVEGFCRGWGVTVIEGLGFTDFVGVGV